MIPDAAPLGKMPKATAVLMLISGTDPNEEAAAPKGAASKHVVSVAPRNDALEA